MGKAIRKVFKIDTLSLHECTDGYYLYDYIVGANIGIYAKTEQDAYIQALLWYQRRYAELEQKKKKLYDTVNNFIDSLSDNDEINMHCDCEE